MFQADDFDEILTEDSFCTIDKALSTIQDNSPLKKKEVLTISQSANIASATATTSTFVSPETPNRCKRKRKFPGPAGLLPDNFQVNNSFRSDKNQELSSQNMLSQNQFPFSVFNENPWIIMSNYIKEIMINNNGLHKITIDCIKNTDHPQLSKRKVPLVAGIIQSIDRSLPDPSLVIYDSTAEIQCTLHRDAWNCFSTFIIPQFSCIVLINSTILTTGTAIKKKYLNITMDNILGIYADEEHVYSSNENAKHILQDVTNGSHFTITCDALHHDRVIIVSNRLGENNLRNIKDLELNSNKRTQSFSTTQSNDPIVNITLEGINTDFLFEDFD